MWAEVGSAFTYEATNSATKDAINTLENKKMKRELTDKKFDISYLIRLGCIFLFRNNNKVLDKFFIFRNSNFRYARFC
ncbi:hypothetical protein L327_12390 [Yersinia pestis S3]|nr:hypothetical protein L327_12390 [Yersinia pestis S3]